MSGPHAASSGHDDFPQALSTHGSGHFTEHGHNLLGGVFGAGVEIVALAWPYKFHEYVLPFP
jgi:hypothetical protein